MSELREALKPCPFCGGAAEAYDRFNVRCTGCGAEINAQPGHAAGLWNCRQSPAPVVEGEAVTPGIPDEQFCWSCGYVGPTHAHKKWCEAVAAPKGE